MSVLQYVGARYTPKLFQAPDGSMEWQPNTYYEPLTIVTYNNAGYVSRIPVSASIGNPALNQREWALFGNFDGQLISLSARVDGLMERSVLIIGDSYAVGVGGTNGWAQQLKASLNSKGQRCDIVAYGTTGFVGGIQKNFVDMLSEAPGAYYDIIIVQGFVNDFVSGETANLRPGVTANMATFATKAYNLFPSAQVLLYPVGHIYTDTYKAGYNTMARTARAHGMGWIDSAQYYLPTPAFFDGDNVHPNQAGHDTIFSHIMGSIDGGTFPDISISANADVAWVKINDECVSVNLSMSKISSLAEPLANNKEFTIPQTFLGKNAQFWRMLPFQYRTAEGLAFGMLILYSLSGSQSLNAQIQLSGAPTSGMIGPTFFNMMLPTSDIY